MLEYFLKSCNDLSFSHQLGKKVIIIILISIELK